MADFLELEHEKASLCQIYQSTHGLYEVSLYGQSQRVSIQRQTCTYRKWEITSIPCEHTYGIIFKKKLEADDYVSNWFYISRWRERYNSSIKSFTFLCSMIFSIGGWTS